MHSRLCETNLPWKANIDSQFLLFLAFIPACEDEHEQIVKFFFISDGLRVIFHRREADAFDVFR